MSNLLKKITCLTNEYNEMLKDLPPHYVTSEGLRCGHEYRNYRVVSGTNSVEIRYPDSKAQIQEVEGLGGAVSILVLDHPSSKVDNLFNESYVFCADNCGESARMIFKGQPIPKSMFCEVNALPVISKEGFLELSVAKGKVLSKA